MSHVLEDLGGLKLSDPDDKQINMDSIGYSKPDFEDSLKTLFIGDTLVSEESFQKVKRENAILKQRIHELTCFYSDYTITLHKMVALLKNQNVAIIKSYNMQNDLPKVESLSINDTESNVNDLISSLGAEENFLCDVIAKKQRELQEQFDSSIVESIRTEGDEKLQYLNNQLEEFKQQVNKLSHENHSLIDSNKQLAAMVKIKDDHIQLLNNKVNMCTSIIEGHNNRSSNTIVPCESQPWVVQPEEIDISNQLLGTGAWGIVSLGTFRGLTVAVKQLHRLILSPHNQEKFLREMEISSRIRHPHILQFICCSQQNRTLYVVTEVMEVSAREAYLSNAISKSQSVRTLLQCGLALQYLHGFKPNPIIHRDISSCNVLLSSKSANGWIAKLSDFGAANFLRDNLSSAPGAAIYAAPEAYSSVQNTKLDVFSFGVLMTELLIHRLPDPQLREAHIQSVEHDELREIIGSMLSRNPDNRPNISSVVGSIRIVLNLPSGVPSDCV